jgi:hypothetical protein
MSSIEAAGDIWRVQLGTGELRVMSLDALDAAFQAGLINESTPVLAPGSTNWTKLADAAGLDASDASDDESGHESNVPSVAPLAVSIASDSTGDATPYSQRPDPLDPLADVDLEIEAELKPKRGRLYAGIGIAVMLVGGLGFAASRVPNLAASASNTLSAKNRAAAAQPPPAAVDLGAADARARQLTEEQRIRLAEFDKANEAREAQKKKDRPPPPAAPARRGPREKGSAPFVNGGNKFDPLNGAL